MCATTCLCVLRVPFCLFLWFIFGILELFLQCGISYCHFDKWKSNPRNYRGCIYNYREGNQFMSWQNNLIFSWALSIITGTKITQSTSSVMGLWANALFSISRRWYKGYWLEAKHVYPNNGLSAFMSYQQ